MSNLFLDPSAYFGKNIIYHGKSQKGESFESDCMDAELLRAPPKTWCFWVDKHVNDPSNIK